MMHRFVIALALAALGQPAVPAMAGMLPAEINYTIYARGAKVGHSSIKTTETADALILESTVKVSFGEVEMVLTCRTEADKETFTVRRMEYRGAKGEWAYQGTYSAVGDSLHMTAQRGGSEQEDSHISPWDRNLVLEDYAFDSQILIALAQSVSQDKLVEGGMVFPSSLVFTSCVVSSASMATVESDLDEAICNKFVISITGSDPYASYYDPERRLPVYMVFPQPQVEVFLDEFYGESPVPRYHP